MRYQRLLLLFPVFLFLLHGTSNASHAMGADLTYECLGGNTYRVRLSFYRDCAGITPSSSVTVSVTSASCGQTLSMTLNKLGTETEVSPLCPPQVANSTCNGGTLPGVEQWIFEGTITLPMACTDWVFGFREGNRNATITTIVSPDFAYLYVEARLNSIAGGCNNSPTFTSLPVPYVCLGQPFAYNHGALDPDGDSLVYTLINALDNAGVPVTYVGGFSGTVPLTSAPPVAISSSSGTITMTPMALEIAVIAVRVDEYRGGVLIGSVIRDIQVTVLNCTNNVPTLSTLTSVTGATVTGPYTLEVCPGTPLSFNITGNDVDAADLLTLDWNYAVGGSLTTSGTHPVVGTFTWTPTPADVGTHTLVFDVADNACPVFGTNFQAVTIEVLQGTVASPDTGYCLGGVPLVLSVSGGSTFTWSILSGTAGSLSCTVCPNPTVTPLTTTTYIVQSNLTGACRNRDTVTVSIAPNFSLTMSPTVTVCAGGSIGISATPSVAGSYTYSWSPSTGLSSTSVGNPSASPSSATTYTVTVSSAAGCVKTGTVTVNVGPPMGIAASAAPTSGCAGGTSNFTTSVTSAVPCTTNTAVCGATTTSTVGTGATSTGLPTPYEGFWHDGRMQLLYLASELTAAGYSSGMINSIGFNVATKGSTQPYQNFTIKIGCTSATSLSASWIPVTHVVFGPASVTTAAGWNTHTLSSRYFWNGSSNLIVEICFDNTSYSDDDDVFYTNSGFTSVAYDYADGDAGCSLAFPSTSSDRPNTRFTFCAPPSLGAVTYSWAPPSGLSSTTISNPVATLGSATQYIVTVTHTGSGCQAQDTINLSVTDVNAGPDQTICIGDTADLVATYAGPPPSGGPSVCGTSTGCSGTGGITNYTLGSGATGTGTGTPYEGFWHDGRVQYLYLASELTAAGLTAGTIRRIGFNVTTKGSTAAYNGFTIRMGCTTATSLSAWLTGLTTVFGPSSVTTTAGANNHVLTTDYNWDGVSNLVVEICFNNTGYTDDDDVAYTTTGFNSVLYDYADADIGCTLAFPATSTQRPNTTFRLCKELVVISYAWTPTGTVTNSTIYNPGAFPATTTSYIVTVNNGSCVVRDTVIVNVGCILPLGGIQLTGRNTSSGNLLSWETRDEQGTQLYVLERSHGGSAFTSIAEEPASGFTTGSTEYEQWDELAPEGKNLYRIKVLNNDGTVSYSNTVEITNAGRTGVTVYPNPAAGVFHFAWSACAPEAESVLEVYDMEGRAVLRLGGLHPDAGGSIHRAVDISSLSDGIYIYRIRCGADVFSGKLNKMR